MREYEQREIMRDDNEMNRGMPSQTTTDGYK